jgi:ribosomal protein S18 acetylase RimI-like enzyme
MKKSIVVRNATRKDLMRVVELEQSIFGAEGLVPLCYKHFATCLEVYPQGFFVAEENDSIVGYVRIRV